MILSALRRLGAKQAPRLLQRALVGRGGFAIDAAVLADNLADPALIFLPALRTGEPDYASLAAVSLLDRGDGCALQR